MINDPFLTEFLCGDSEPLALLAFCASDVPNLKASYTGSTLLPQALEKNWDIIKADGKQMLSFQGSHVVIYNTTTPSR